MLVRRVPPPPTAYGPAPAVQKKGMEAVPLSTWRPSGGADHVPPQQRPHAVPPRHAVPPPPLQRAVQLPPSQRAVQPPPSQRAVQPPAIRGGAGGAGSGTGYAFSPPPAAPAIQRMAAFAAHSNGQRPAQASRRPPATIPPAGGHVAQPFRAFFQRVFPCFFNTQNQEEQPGSYVSLNAEQESAGTGSIRYFPPDTPSTIRNFPAPTPEEQIVSAWRGRKDINVILWRGDKEIKIENMKKTKCAGDKNYDPIKPKSQVRPTETEAMAQAGEFGRLPEFTSSEAIAVQFGRGNHVVVVSINSKYLTRGSVVESGWVCYNEAPIKVLASAEMPRLKF